MKLKYALTLPLGMILLAIGIIMEKFLPSSPILDFIEGLLFGLSIVLNIYYIASLIHRSRKE